MLSLGYTQTIRPGVKGSFGLALDTQKFNDVTPNVGPMHKVCSRSNLRVAVTDVVYTQRLEQVSLSSLKLEDVCTILLMDFLDNAQYTSLFW